ncbi:hypothetical protein HN51_064515 [Arachis hypogaea]
MKPSLPVSANLGHDTDVVEDNGEGEEQDYMLEPEFQPPISEVVKALILLDLIKEDPIEGVMYPPYMMICEWEYNPCAPRRIQYKAMLKTCNMIN